MSINTDSNLRPNFDKELIIIADYLLSDQKFSDGAYETAYYALLDSLGCALLALNYPECRKLLGPIVAETIVPNGVKIPGTHFQLDPVTAAFNIGAMIRWLDFNDTWLAAEWGHPSDNLGAILAVADYLNRRGKKILIKDILHLMIQAYEIQGIIALENSFNRVGLDHVILVKLASVAVAAKLFDCNREQILAVLSQVFVDGQSLRTYRHAPNVGSRKSWAAGDATSRAVFLTLLTLRGEMGYPSSLSAPCWGFYETLFNGKSFNISREFESYVMENILFKIAFPAEFHAQTAIEAAIKLYPQVKDRWDSIQKIVITTHESAIRIISKTGPLYNAADRDHCLQYMVAIGLLYGELNADHYEDKIAEDLRIDELRNKMHVQENKQFSQDYLDPEKRSIANSIQIYFVDGTTSDEIIIEYPLGHKNRRNEGIPLLINKFKNNIVASYPLEKSMEVITYLLDKNKMSSTSISNIFDLLAL